MGVDQKPERVVPDAIYFKGQTPDVEMVSASAKFPFLSEEKVKYILKRYTPILHKNIAEAGTFFGRPYLGKLCDALPMTNEEVEKWNQCFGIKDVVMDRIKNGELFVADISADEINLLQGQTGDTNDTITKAIASTKKKANVRRINLDEKIEAPIKPFDPDGMRFFVSLHAHFGGQTAGQLYNAFISTDIYVQDKFGRWGVMMNEATSTYRERDGWPIYFAKTVAGNDVWFNCSIKPELPNSYEIRVDKPDYLMQSCAIHHLDQIDQMKVPADARANLFYWQVYQFLNYPKFGKPSILGLLPDGER